MIRQSWRQVEQIQPPRNGGFEAMLRSTRQHLVRHPKSERRPACEERPRSLRSQVSTSKAARRQVLTVLRKSEAMGQTNLDPEEDVVAMCITGLRYVLGDLSRAGSSLLCTL